MGDDIRFGPCRMWLGMMVAARPVASKCRRDIELFMESVLCFHAISIVEQENWGNAIYVMAGDYFAVWAKPVPFRVAIMIAIVADGVAD